MWGRRNIKPIDNLIAFFYYRWIIHAMRYELKIRSGEQPEQDIYQLSPGEIKQLLLCILQPQQSGR